jgi:hypothetical protein
MKAQYCIGYFAINFTIVGVKNMEKTSASVLAVMTCFNTLIVIGEPSEVSSG